MVHLHNKKMCILRNSTFEIPNLNPNYPREDERFNLPHASNSYTTMVRHTMSVVYPCTAITTIPVYMLNTYIMCEIGLSELISSLKYSVLSSFRPPVLSHLKHPSDKF